MITTKEQERKALAQIKKIVEGLGENSYVATAFEGCFEIAESNIDNDWACSMKQKVESAEKNATDLAQALHDMSVKLAGQVKATEINHSNAVNEIKELEEELREYRQKVLPDEARSEILHYLGHRASVVEKSMANTAELIVDMANHPTDIAFTSSVKSYKEEREERKLIKRMIHNLIKTNA